MELSVRKSHLLHELQLCQGIVERKNTIPILSNVLLETDGDDSVELLATDLDVTLRTRCEASIGRAGSVTVPAKKLFEIVRNLPETEILIREEAKGTVSVQAENFHSKLQTLPREDFPTLPDVAEDGAVPVDRAALRGMVSKTSFAITGEDTRFYLNGALFVVKNEAMSLIATDGHRLALAAVSRDAEAPAVGELSAILPKKTLNEVNRLLVDGDGDLQYSIGESHLFFQVDGRLLISRNIDATFPTYERVIPTSNDKTVEIDRDRLTSAIRRVALLSNERSHAMKFQITAKARADAADGAPDGPSAEVSAESPEHGRANEIIPIDYDGPDLLICFNAQYVLDFLGVVETEAVTLELKDETSQAVMHPTGEESNYTYVIMPMRV
ncbi:MAG: DNA polymerase III subunit beta [Acidobacteria bacterium]|nr:DNA polymerase III subunit beta [Acidobacteriota bacterium]